jgi:tetratricopeptide (TPR) repeat protein
VAKALLGGGKAMNWKRTSCIALLLLAFGGCCLAAVTGIMTRSLYHIWQGDVAMGETRYQDAIQYYTTAIHTAVIEAWKAKAYQKRADGYIKLGEYDKAIDDLTVVVAQDSSNSTAYYNRGVAYALTGDSQRAVDDLTKTIELKPDEALAYASRGLAYLTMEQPEKAIEDFTKLLTFDDSLALVYRLCGFAFEDAGNYDQALADFKETEAKSEDAEFAAIARMDQLRVEAQTHLVKMVATWEDLADEIESEEEFDKVRVRAMAALSKIEEERDTILDKVQEAKDLPLPGWYQVYLNKVEESNQMERKAVQLLNQALQEWVKLDDALSKVARDLEDIEPLVSFLERQSEDWIKAIEEGRYLEAIRITRQIQEEVERTRTVFSTAYQETECIETFQAIVEFIDKIGDLAQHMEDLAQAEDLEALEKAMIEMYLSLDDIEAKFVTLEMKLSGLDLEYERCLDYKLTPLLNQFDDKFAEAVRLEEEANAFFEANQPSLNEYFKDLFVETTE